MTDAIRDNNHRPVALGVSSTDSTVTLPLKVDPATGRLLTDAAGGYTNLTQFVDQTAWRIFYSDGNGDVQELALGASGTVLTSGGATSAPTWAATAGDVTAAANLGDNLLIRGDGAVKGVQNSGITVDDSNNITGAANISATGATLSGLTASEIVITDGSKNLASAAVATYPSLTELTYVKGVTSAIQTQLNAKQATITFGTGVETALGVNVGSAGAFVTFNGALGTPSSGALTNCTAYPGDSSLVTSGALNSGSITSGFGAIDNGASNITTTGDISGGTVNATSDTAAGDNAAIGYTAAEGLILTGQGSTDDVTIKNDADAAVLTVPTGTTDVEFQGAAIFDAEVDNGNSGTADTIDWTAGNKQKSTLTGNVTYTFTEPNGPCNLVFKMVQDATGSRTATWPADVNWAGGTAPTLTTTGSATDIITFYYDGTDFYGGVGGLDFS